MLTTIERLAAPIETDSAVAPADRRSTGRDRIRRLISWSTAAFAMSAALTGAALILWTVSR